MLPDGSKRHERELHEARKALDSARAAHGAVDRALHGEIFELERELMESADERLREFARHLDNAKSLINASWRTTSYQTKEWVTGKTRPSSNPTTKKFARSAKPSTRRCWAAMQCACKRSVPLTSPNA